MRVLIFEPQFVGHNLVHVARLVRGLRDLPCETVVATSSQAIESDEFQLHLGSCHEEFALQSLDGFQTDSLGRQVRTAGLNGIASSYRGLKRAVELVRPDHVYVPYGNFLARFACLPGGLSKALRRQGAEAETLVVGGRYFYPQTGLLKQSRQKALLAMIARGPWTRLFHLDDRAVEQMKSFGGRLAEIAHLLPEPIGDFPRLSKREARTQLGAPLAGRQVVVTGLIEPRKGLASLFSAMRLLDDRLRSDDRLLLVGPHHPDALAMLQGEFADLIRAKRVVSIDRRLAESEMAVAASAADVVATVYPRHPYASGVLASAASAGRQALGSSEGWIARTIHRFDLGRTCQAHDPRDVANQMFALLENPEDYRPTPAAERFVAFARERNYVALWTARLRERMGLPQSAEAKSWEWTLGQETVARAA